MQDMKRFEAKSVESAIEQACTYFNTTKDGLDIEVIDSGSSGIFGLGGRNAAIQAAVQKKAQGNDKTSQGRDKEPQGRDKGPRANDKKSPDNGKEPQGNDKEIRGNEQELAELVQSVVSRLLAPLIDAPTLDVQFEQDRINVTIQDQEYSGLIIGKEGQTISSLEYMVNRIVAKSWPERVYVQLDAGGYRQRQDDQVRQKALYLAQKVKESGKAQSTKPMSSYHRRLVHVALQDETDLITRSKGDGPMKRVLIALKKRKEQQEATQTNQEGSGAESDKQ
ncbi:RNA-binding cell elongation regulator Jag/EloR [Desulfovermiculus halophilus]|uniref:RNA-binding cell elongation regulator Jag/EloR n=1 Tax=Desulfovermiculus halophilus TaxID=339722 RepID=UPI0006860AE8|nr:RNA-binding cell elongation regulator Jag/EloR [Desulfovermiculus halophilus]